MFYCMFILLVIAPLPRLPVLSPIPTNDAFNDLQESSTNNRLMLGSTLTAAAVTQEAAHHRRVRET